jgi:SAM-dependent methyltransferase
VPQHDPTIYGAQWADDYDTSEVPCQAETDAAVRSLFALARGGPVLEVAAGTGRLALPLAEAGLRVVATDVSPQMLDKLRAKDPAGLVESRLEDMAAISGDERYALVVIALSSLWAHVDVEMQLRALQGAAAHLREDGVVVVEMVIPDLATLHQTVGWQDPGLSVVRETEWELVTQRLRHRFHLDWEDGRSEVREIRLRMVLPCELLLLARLAGLRPRHLWDGWSQRPVTDQSRWIVAVLERDVADITSPRA